MGRPQIKIFRRELAPQFIAAATKKPQKLLPLLLAATQHVRDAILLPSAQNLDDIPIEHKDTGAQRDADAKTFTIITDKQCEAEMARLLSASFPQALLISEEKYGDSATAEKQRVLDEALATDRMVILTDPLDATRDFRTGGDGYGTLVAVLQNGEITAAVAHRSTDYADPSGLGHTLTFEKGDGVRRDGRLISPLSGRVFPDDTLKLRGYAGAEFIAPMRRKGAADKTGFPDLAGKFDSLSDLWTCSKLLDDLLTGTHHFALVPPPPDLFDYPAALGLINAAGGTARFLDGTPATFAEIVRRQNFDGDDKAAKALLNTLVFAVSENVFKAVQKTVCDAAGLTIPARPSPREIPKPRIRDLHK